MGFVSVQKTYQIVKSHTSKGRIPILKVHRPGRLSLKPSHSVFKVPLKSTRSNLTSYSIHRCYSQDVNKGQGSNQEKSSQEKDSKFSSFMRHLFRNFYVLDTRMTWKILLLLFPSACAMLYYTWAKWKDQKERMEFFERHFVCNMKNIEEGRPYTVLTSAFGASGNFSAHTVSEICSLLLFGGFFIRNIGFLRTAAFFYGAHTFSTIVSLLFNHVPMRKIEAYREWLPKGEETQFSPYKIRFEKKKLAFAVEDELAAKGVTDYFEIERRQREILGMEDEQFLTYAYNYYLNRVAYTSGAGLATTFLVSMLYPKGLIPFPMIGIPLFIFAPFQLYLSIQNHYQYTNLELVAQTSSIILFPALMAITFIKRQHFVRDLPSNMMDQLNMAKWLPRRDIKIKKSVEKEKIREIPGMEKKTVLSKEEIEMMRKRNEKIQNRMKNKGK